MALSIGVGCASLVWIAAAIGLISDPFVEQGNSRLNSTKTLAVNVATFAENRSQVNLKKVLKAAVDSDDSIRSIGVKRGTGNSYLMSFGPHKESWEPEQTNDAGKQIGVEIFTNKKHWGNMEIAFEPFQEFGSMMGLAYPFGFVIYPSKVVPGRVKSALDTLAEGLVLLDGNGEIAHANESFQQIACTDGEMLLGRNLNSFGWKKEGADDAEGMPWEQCLAKHERVSRHVVSLTLEDSTVLWKTKTLNLRRSLDRCEVLVMKLQDKTND